MKRYIGSCVLLAAGILFGTTTVEAQVFTPSFMAPRRSMDVGVYLSDGPGEFAVEGIWRRGFGEFDLGFRAGVADTPEASILLAGEYRNPLALSAPIDVSITAAVQGAIGGTSTLGAMVGTSIGHTFATPEINFTPYFHPRIGLIEDDLEMLADLGLDLGVGSSLEVRLAIVVEEAGSEWGVGLSW
jgi:hypothetical protein